MTNIIVLDLETARSAEDCRHCDEPQDMHGSGTAGWCRPYENISVGGTGEVYTPIGWDNKPALGLSIGGYYDYEDSRIHWFDEYNLEGAVETLVERQPLMVSFNGIGFDFPLMRGILRRRAQHIRINSIEDMFDKANSLNYYCNLFKELAANSYDILAEIWKADPDRKYERGLNSLEAIAQANGLGPKLSHGAQAPRDWQAGKHADVVNYCQDDVLKTKALFELIRDCNGELIRGGGQTICLPWVDKEGHWHQALPF